MPIRSRAAALLAGSLAASSAAPQAGNAGWPGLWGPDRDGRAPASLRLPEEALRGREAWRRPLGSGFSGIALVGGRGFTAAQDGAEDLALAFDPGSGRELWRAPLGPTYRGHDGSKDGPAATPAADGERVYVVSRRGLLLALRAGDGTVAWRHDLKAEFAAPAPYYGFASSPLLSGRNVVVQAGGESGLIAFDRASGAVAWSAAHSKTAGYASPVPATLLGAPQILALANDAVYGVRPEDGTLVWSHPTGWSEEAVRPPLALPEDRVLISGSAEAKLLALGRDGERIVARELWRSPRLKNSLSATVFHDGRLFGFASQYLVCLDPASAEPLWREKVYAGALALLDGHLVIVGAESGELRVGRISTAGYQERLRMAVFNAGATSVTGPALLSGRVFLRNVEELVAVDLIP